MMNNWLYLLINLFTTREHKTFVNMSTTYGILVEDYSSGVEEYDGKFYCEVAFVTNSGTTYFTNPIAYLLPDETKVTALDNDP